MEKLESQNINHLLDTMLNSHNGHVLYLFSEYSFEPLNQDMLDYLVLDDFKSTLIPSE